MKVENVLVELEKLLQSWRIHPTDWILVSQYAYKLLGYRVKIRYGHFNILVRKMKIPWKIEEGVEIHPPHGTVYRNSFEEFIEKTGFDFDINLAEEMDYEAKDGKYLLYKLPNGIKIRVQKPTGAIREFEKLLSLSTREGFGVERLDKDIYYIKDMIRALSLKKEENTLNEFRELLDKYYAAKKASKLIKQTSPESIRGISASKGKALGKVALISDMNTVNKISESCILVTKMTSPMITTLLPKISAIVTDQGGMLSHAAILARELGIPCIVGTQIATEFFKNGDLVEVDADNGVVRKLNNEKN
ncbi:hypothetical protein A2962_05080 [Candidatus Woesebacteria bacterium RIFCSPLOWO2_01_FULL_39_61]|uniref:PEP-utilising enzyme mobile domain-containing protein n=1 Tax=Candidatus Woesebacteria bacterium RIFCSPHIGHO2_02_FULL_39_13 TaxID=1802505 RepID=A0A1F7YZD0_9BACT|nr:MAG: hypothetical protein A2692_03330 [Candidatus Woesebacteria bacterium RIFCSPHIGHO2_01_FULL_39_95]OGM32641.1 MAG: hypothetical protein A3D01_05305 [Candidatus Woesebacteria bacterium RIFCSPHIGHO2_02_FULL_39_13]OGM66709.1 MAG: hypothetical protein A2962_05080 [Candidatus Woesebacteria bacterium RIFCSPLOWO2_01_FULL_39_61]OGM73780.1 MAG: hypothetical protein A3H19_02600 [Candidatus Woesebacteria bacterium RIFCSPLOWO2_12_FULL_39_9]